MLQVGNGLDVMAVIVERSLKFINRELSACKPLERATRDDATDQFLAVQQGKMDTLGTGERRISNRTL
jgi:hypothetical protein